MHSPRHFVSCVPSADDGQHITERLERCVNDVLRFAIASQRSRGKDIIDSPGNAAVRIAVANEYCKRAPVGIERARNRALANATLHSTTRIRKWKCNGNAAAFEMHSIGVNGNIEFAQGVLDRIVETIADDSNV